MPAPLEVAVRPEVDTERIHLTVCGDLTEHSCPELTKIIDRTVRTIGSKLVLDLSETARTDAAALDMLSTHIALLPERVRLVTRTPAR